MPLKEIWNSSFKQIALKVIGKSIIVWFGEVAIAFIPLLSHVVVLSNTTEMFEVTACVKGTIKCLPIHETWPLAEMDVLAVVISGLGLLSLLKAAAYEEDRQFTPMTVVVAVVALILLTVGSLLYALSSANVDNGSGKLTVLVLILSGIISLYLAFEEGWLHALRSYKQSARASTHGVPLGGGEGSAL